MPNLQRKPMEKGENPWKKTKKPMEKLRNPHGKKRISKWDFTPPPKKKKKRPKPGDSKWPFHPLVGGHLTFLKGSLNHPKKVSQNCQECGVPNFQQTTPPKVSQALGTYLERPSQTRPPGESARSTFFCPYGCQPKNRGSFPPKMDGENKKLENPIFLNGWFWGAHPYFWKTPHISEGYLQH